MQAALGNHRHPERSPRYLRMGRGGGQCPDSLYPTNIVWKKTRRSQKQPTSFLYCRREYFPLGAASVPHPQVMESPKGSHSVFNGVGGGAPCTRVRPTKRSVYIRTKMVNAKNSTPRFPAGTGGSFKFWISTESVQLTRPVSSVGRARDF